MVEMYKCGGIFEKEVAVGFEMHDPSLFHDFTIMGEKFGAGEAFALLLHLWVRKGDPYFADLPWSEKRGE
jgi:hypothetical protein